jgi:hypothetical protein
VDMVTVESVVAAAREAAPDAQVTVVEVDRDTYVVDVKPSGDAASYRFGILDRFPRLATAGTEPGTWAFHAYTFDPDGWPAFSWAVDVTADTVGAVVSEWLDG